MSSWLILEWFEKKRHKFDSCFSFELLGRSGLLAAGTLGVGNGLIGSRKFRVGLGKVLLVLQLFKGRLFTAC